MFKNDLCESFLPTVFRFFTRWNSRPRFSFEIMKLAILLSRGKQKWCSLIHAVFVSCYPVPSHVTSDPIVLMKEPFCLRQNHDRFYQRKEKSGAFRSSTEVCQWREVELVFQQRLCRQMWSTNWPVSFLLFILPISGQWSDHCFSFGDTEEKNFCFCHIIEMNLLKCCRYIIGTSSMQVFDTIYRLKA